MLPWQIPVLSIHDLRQWPGWMIKTPLHSSPTPAPVPSQGYGTGWPSGDHPRVPCLHTASPVFHRSDVSLSTWISESGFVCLGVCCVLSGLGSCCEIPGSGNSRGTGCERPADGLWKAAVSPLSGSMLTCAWQKESPVTSCRYC